jgi:hypothetical protein
MSLEDVQIMAGHSYPSTTEQYINPNTQEIMEATPKAFGRGCIKVFLGKK